MADGKEVDGKPSLRYITLLRDGGSRPPTARVLHPFLGGASTTPIGKLVQWMRVSFDEVDRIVI